MSSYTAQISISQIIFWSWFIEVMALATGASIVFEQLHS